MMLNSIAYIRSVSIVEHDGLLIPVRHVKVGIPHGPVSNQLPKRSILALRGERIWVLVVSEQVGTNSIA